MRLAYVLLMVAACVDSSKGPEEALPEDGQADSARSPTDHGSIALGTTETSDLTTDARYHQWTFVLGGSAEIHAYTSRTPHDASVDTVLYLYKQSSTGSWGSYIARNDDDGTSLWSSIDKELGIGEYRVLVKGYSTSTLGSFDVTVDCTGAGCTPP
jgi:hypothetical protein